ncbi:DUF1707 SHOCT-like domain-containing protein [Jiangella ureilytica]|uniref:DUF1707 SHOCT-like domain-containing protein n=1 Tax=Jiangella ureilytica TaxID=2530374 RepID=UPI0013A5F260|nr:DUF1707 domain-containing protein [Jiangella ureilytica]
MSRPDRKWRPSDSDRERYASAVSQAFAEGRIDAADMETRTALIYEAKSIADLDALVEDMPAPAATPAPAAQDTATRSSGIGVGWVVGAVAAVLVIMFAVLSSITDGFTSADSSSDDWAVVDPPPEPPEPPEPPGLPAPDLADLPPIDTVKDSLFTDDGLGELWNAMPAAGHTDLYEIALRPDRATVEALAGTSRPSTVRVEYVGELVLPPEPYRDVMAGDQSFTWADVTPEAVLAAISAMPGVTVSHISIDNDFDGQVTISVYPEGDTDITYARFDASGQLIGTS